MTKRYCACMKQSQTYLTKKFKVIILSLVYCSSTLLSRKHMEEPQHDTYMRRPFCVVSRLLSGDNNGTILWQVSGDKSGEKQSPFEGKFGLDFLTYVWHWECPGVSPAEEKTLTGQGIDLQEEYHTLSKMTEQGSANRSWFLKNTTTEIHANVHLH